MFTCSKMPTPVAKGEFISAVHKLEFISAVHKLDSSMPRAQPGGVPINSSTIQDSVLVHYDEYLVLTLQDSSCPSQPSSLLASRSTNPPSSDNG